MAERTEAVGRGAVGAPACPPRTEGMLHALTFFTTSAERAAVLRALTVYGDAGRGGRTGALLAALGIDADRVRAARRA